MDTKKCISCGSKRLDELEDGGSLECQKCKCVFHWCVNKYRESDDGPIDCKYCSKDKHKKSKGKKYLTCPNCDVRIGTLLPKCQSCGVKLKLVLA